MTTRATGLRSFAFHPDFARKGAPGRGKLYTVTTETVASRPAGVRLFAGPYPAALHDVVAEWSVDAAHPDRVDPGSRRELFRVAQLSAGHCADQLMFDPNARPGDTAYGALWLGVGDGGDFEHPDPYNLAQNPGVAAGKLLRVDPLRRARRPTRCRPTTRSSAGPATCPRSGRSACGTRKISPSTGVAPGG